MLLLLFLFNLAKADIPAGTSARTMVGIEACLSIASETKPCLPPAQRMNANYAKPSIQLRVGDSITIQRTEGDQIYFTTMVKGKVVQGYAHKDLILRTTKAGYLLIEPLSIIEKRFSGRTNLLQRFCPSIAPISEFASRLKCPNVEPDEEGRIDWGFREARSFISFCDIPTLNFVKRKNVDDISTKCLPKDKIDHSNKQEWEACPPTPLCNEQQTAEERRKAALQLLTDKSRCDPSLGPVVPPVKATPKPATINEMCTPPLEKPNRIVLHHTAATPYMDAADIQYSHLKSGWSDLGYHFVIAKTPSGGWKVFEGRPLTHQGAHVGAGLNENSIGIAIAGNYHPQDPASLNPAAPDSVPSPEATAQLMALIDHLTKTYPDIKDIQGHSHAKLDGSSCHTECPGPGVEQIVGLLKARFSQKLLEGK